MLKKIKIVGLFNQFNYDIDLKPEGLTILTGPNGYGKTTILKIIHAFAVKNLSFFFELPFKEIVLTLEQDEISIVKVAIDRLKIQSGDKLSLQYKDTDTIPKAAKELLSGFGYTQLNQDQWFDAQTKETYTSGYIVEQLVEHVPELFKHSLKEIPDLMDVYFIREQRLIKTSNIIKQSRNLFIKNNANGFYKGEKNSGHTIEIYAKELVAYIKRVQAEASKIAQGLDSNFPNRLFEATDEVSEIEFNERYEAIRTKQRILNLYGLSATQENHHTLFKPENAKVLRVYLGDMEEKLAAYNELLQEFELFATRLKEKQLVSKQLEISAEFGFRFKTPDCPELPLTLLSSGEQQQVVLLYELLFRVEANALLLIDEPEISLHVAWQRRFLDDLLKIIELRKITAIVATHSPQIIGNHWDLEVDLYDLSMAVEEVAK